MSYRKYATRIGLRLTGLFITAISAATVSIACTTSTLSTPTPTATKCQVTASGPQAAIAGIGGSGTVVVNAEPECPWSVSTEASWITDVSPAKGQGAANIQFKAAPNPVPAPRQGDIAVSGALVHINQDSAPCVFDVKPQTITIGFVGGHDSVTVTTTPGCAWSALSQVDWITVTSPKDNSGAGTVTFDVASYTDAGARTGSIAVAGQTITVSQSERNCIYSINPSTANFTNAGGAGSVSVTAPTGCAWTAASSAAWIVVNSGANVAGPGSVAYSVGANAGGPARTATMTIAGQTFTVTQDTGCSYGINPMSQNVARTAGTGTTVAITTQPSCSWTAVSNASWITINSPASGSGNGNVGWTYAENVVPAPRTGTMIIAGQPFTVTQDPGCSYVISPTSQSLRDPAGTGITVTVTTQTACFWTAVSNASWITLNTSSGSGNGSVGWTYTANTMPGISRTGTMTIAGQTFTVDQAGPCTYTVAPLGQTVSDLGGAGQPITVTTQAGCAWTAVSNDSWITVTSGATGTGSGQVQISISRNVVYAARAGTLVIAGQVVTVIQNGVPTLVRAERIRTGSPDAAASPPADDSG